LCDLFTELTSEANSTSYIKDPTQNIQDVCNIPVLPFFSMGVEPTNGESAYRTALLIEQDASQWRKSLQYRSIKCSDK
jgi:hypothetical protein